MQGDAAVAKLWKVLRTCVLRTQGSCGQGLSPTLMHTPTIHAHYPPSAWLTFYHNVLPQHSSAKENDKLVGASMYDVLL